MMKLTNQKQRQGEMYEQLACLFLQAQGLVLVAKNWHCRAGELDLVMLDNTQHLPCLVVVEVRQRKIGAFGVASESITASKQQKIIKATQNFLQQNQQFENHDIRFDVVTFDISETQAKKSLAMDMILTGQQPPPLPEWTVSAFLVN